MSGDSVDGTDAVACVSGGFACLDGFGLAVLAACVGFGFGLDDGFGDSVVWLDLPQSLRAAWLTALPCSPPLPLGALWATEET